MLQKFLKNIILILFLNLLIKPFWILGIDREVQNVLGAGIYGFYYAVFSLTFLFNILLDMGITNYNNRNISQNNHLLSKHVSGIVLLKLLLGVVYLIITLVAAFVIKYSFEHYMLLLVLSFNQFLISFVLYLRSNLAGLQLFKIDSVVSVLDRLIMIIICAVLLWGNLPIQFSLAWFVFAQTAAYFITAIITLFIVLSKAESSLKKINWSLPFSIMIIKNSFPFAILVLLMTFYNRIDSVMLERMLPNGAEQAGIYASAYRLLDAVNMIAYLFAVLLLPIFSKMLKEKLPVDDLVRVAFILLFIPAMAVACCCYFYAYPLMDLMYKEHISASASVFAVLMFCFVPIASTYVFGTLLTANGNLKQLNSVALGGMVLNVILNLILIPRFFAMGSALSSLITQVITAIIQIILAHRVFKFSLNTNLLIKLGVITAIIIAAGYFSVLISSIWIVNMFFMFGSIGISVLVLKIIKLSSVMKILLNNK